MNTTSSVLFLLLMIVLLWWSSTIQLRHEYFENEEPRQGNPFCTPLGMTRYRQVADGECCDVEPAGLIRSATCNRVPIFPSSLEPKENIIHETSSTLNPIPFEELTKKEGKFTFLIPELKYDGIWNKQNSSESCCWTLKTNKNKKKKTYGTNKFLIKPEFSMFGCTIVQPPECAGLWPSSNPPITYVYDCPQNH